MIFVRRPTRACLALTLSLAATSAFALDEDCDSESASCHYVDPTSYGSATAAASSESSSTSFKIVRDPPTIGCPQGVRRCLQNDTPPDPVYLNCESNGNGYVCEAWPQPEVPDDLSYDWSAGGSIRIPYPTHSAYISVSCWRGGQGTLTVTVWNGTASGTATQSLFCPF